MPNTSKRSKTIVLGQITSPHGVRGAFRLRSFTEIPEDVLAYGPLSLPDGKALKISIAKPLKPGMFLATAPELPDRTAVEAVAGALLTVPRDRMPAPEEEDFYISDLEGLSVHSPEGQDIGTVKTLHNFGAGDILEVSLKVGGPAVLVPFDKEHVPDLDVSAGTLTVVLPVEDED